MFKNPFKKPSKATEADDCGEAPVSTVGKNSTKPPQKSPYPPSFPKLMAKKKSFKKS